MVATLLRYGGICYSFTQIFSDHNSERATKIGMQLTKLSQFNKIVDSE